MITFRLDPTSGVPPYKQIVQQVEHAVRSGRLCEGDQLPLVRELVSALSINPNTALKAYRQLDAQGLTEGRPGVGTFRARGAGPCSLEIQPATVMALVGPNGAGKSTTWANASALDPGAYRRASPSVLPSSRLHR